MAVPSGCDLTRAPKDSPACVDDTVGVFVAASGDDAAAGTKTAPVRSLAKGLELASAKARARVYVCEGLYETSAEIKAPVSVFGGLTCAWSPTDAKPKLAPAKGIALRVTHVTGNVLVADMEIVGSADAKVPGDSAIAIFVSESTSVTLRNLTASAGPGVRGADGAVRSNYSGVATGGGNALLSVGGAGPLCACSDGVTSSKGGGGANGSGGGIESGTAVPSVGGANKGSTTVDTSCTPGTGGANGLASGPGTPSVRAGDLSFEAWASVTSSASAPDGNPGQGGGGGGAQTNFNGGGGGGGCGGCGGAGGAAGENGGSSFALLSFQSTLTLEGARLTSGSGAEGSIGGPGQPGQTGGVFGTGECDGGAGGNGAGGSGGSGGAGGHSAAVGFVGLEPRVTGVVLTPGAPGIGGAGGAAGTGPGNAGSVGARGVDGKSQSSLSL